jgi:hypothetical protein
LDTYKELLSCCPEEPYKKGAEQHPCDFSQYVSFDSRGNLAPKLKGDAKWDNCANLSFKIGIVMALKTNNVYNTYMVLSYHQIITLNLGLL